MDGWSAYPTQPATEAPACSSNLDPHRPSQTQVRQRGSYLFLNSILPPTTTTPSLRFYHRTCLDDHLPDRCWTPDILHLKIETDGPPRLCLPKRASVWELPEQSPAGEDAVSLAEPTAFPSSLIGFCMRRSRVSDGPRSSVAIIYGKSCTFLLAPPRHVGFVRLGTTALLALHHHVSWPDGPMRSSKPSDSLA